MAGEHILIVDDEIDVLELCERILKSKGYAAKTARNGREAVELAQQYRFNLLLTDIKMPGMNGLEIAQALKKSDPGVICVAMTGYSTMDMVLDALKLGIDEFILKPFTPDELSIAVFKATEKERLRKENFRLRSLIPLFELNKTLMGTVEVEKVLKRLLEIAQQETQANLAGLYIIDREMIVSQLEYSGLAEKKPEWNSICEQLVHTVRQSGQQLILSRKEASPDAQNLLDQLQTQAIIGTPIKAKETQVGVLILCRTKQDFAPSDRDFLAVLCGQAGIALENARLFTEIQEAYKELQKLDHMKREFINIAAHELRTPLTILMGYASVLEEEAEGKLREYALSINRNGMRLRALIEDMLNLKYLESGMAVLTHDELNLPEVMQEIMKDMTLLTEQKKLTITVDIPEQFPILTADRQKFDLIITNLLHNAIKFTPSGGHVSLKAEAGGEYAVISVNDTGIGIPKEKFDKIFDRFYQVEPSLTREYGGIGLGLAIAKGMVELCGGQINVESQQGVGTVFTFTLPLDNTALGPRKLVL